MKWLKRIFWFPLLLLQACFSRFSGEVDKNISTSYYYAKRSGEIIYSPMGNWFELGYDKVGADKETFRPLAEDFGKDKDHVYYKSEKLDLIDLETFTIADGVIKDKRHVYYERDRKISVVEGADPKSYRYIENDSHRWAKDNLSYFLYDHRVDAHYATLKTFKSGIAADKDYIYEITSVDENDSTPISEMTTWPIPRLRKRDEVTGEVQELTSVYVRMGNTIYSDFHRHGFLKTTLGKIDTIRIVDDVCIIVDETLFVEGIKFPYDGVDIATFQNFEGHPKYFFTKDKNNVYFDGHLVKGADVASFEVLEDGYARDNRHVYYHNELIEGAAPETFRYVESKYLWTDGKNYYRAGKRSI